MKRRSAKRPVKVMFNTKLVRRVVERIGPKTDLLIDQISLTIAPTVARVHQWCEQRNQLATGKRRVKRKVVVEDTASAT